MSDARRKFLAEAERFRTWSAKVVVTATSAEWQSDYPEWEKVYEVSSEFLGQVDIEDWDDEVITSLLFVIDGDNEMQIVAEEIGQHPEKLLHLTQVALPIQSWAKWQLAVELGKLSGYQPEAEKLLYALAKDEDEYTRRRALRALAEMRSPYVEELIEPAWSSEHQYQRMMVLFALYTIQSSELEKYLKFAEEDGREFLMGYVTKIRRGEAD